MPKSRLARFHKTGLNGNTKKVILDPINGYTTVQYRRVGGKIHRQLFPNNRYNIADGLISGGRQSTQSTHSHRSHSHKTSKVSKQKIAQGISRLLRGGSIAKL